MADYRQIRNRFLVQWLVVTGLCALMVIFAKTPEANVGAFVAIVLMAGFLATLGVELVTGALDRSWRSGLVMLILVFIGAMGMIKSTLDYSAFYDAYGTEEYDARTLLWASTRYLFCFSFTYLLTIKIAGIASTAFRRE